MSGLVWYWGNYHHNPGEIFPQVIEARPVYSDRGIRWATDVRYQCAGDVLFTAAEKAAIAAGSTTEHATLTTRINTLESEYQSDYKDFGFKLDDGGGGGLAAGTLTSHHIETDDPNNLSGNRMVSVSFPSKLPSEYANTRSFGFTVMARVLDSYSQIVYFKEKITTIGTGGPDWTYRSRYTGPPVREDIHEQTPVRIVQQGMVVGLSAYPAVPSPWWPADEIGPRRSITRESGRIHGHPSLARGTHYGLRYRFEFLQPTGNTQSPPIWR